MANTTSKKCKRCTSTVLWDMREEEDGKTYWCPECEDYCFSNEIYV